jgi:hypothetical protein
MCYEDLLHRNMDYWKRKNGLNPTPLSSRFGLGIEGNRIQLDFSQFLDCVASDVEICDTVIDRNVSFSPMRESDCACPGLGGGLFPSSSRIVPSPRSNPAGHLGSCIFNSSDHLLLCHADPIYHRWDLVDQHFPIASPLQFDRSIIEVDSPEREQAIIESPSQSVSGSCLSRAERNLLTAQLKPLQSTHSFGPSEPVIQPNESVGVPCSSEPVIQPNELVGVPCTSEPIIERNPTRNRALYYRNHRQREMDSALMYEQIKRDFLCSHAGWDEATIIAALPNDVGCCHDVAAAPATVNPSLPDLSPTSLLFPIIPISANMSIGAPAASIDCPLPTDAFVSASVPCSLAGAGNGFVNSDPQHFSTGQQVVSVAPNGTSVPAQHVSPSVEQSCNFGGPIQYFFNIGRINLYSSVSIGDFLSSLSRLLLVVCKAIVLECKARAQGILEQVRVKDNSWSSSIILYRCLLVEN